MSKRDLYIERIKNQLDELNAKVGQVEAKAKDAKDEACEKYNEEIAKLRIQSAQAISKLEELKTAGEGHWDSMVSEMEKVSDAFKHSFNYFKSQLKSGGAETPHDK